MDIDIFEVGKTIEHKGRVLMVDGDRIDVEIIAESACAGCSVSKACGMGGQKEKIVQLLTKSARFYEAGEDVMVYMEERKGIKAAMYAYMLPLVLLIAVLLILTELGMSDVVVALGSLGSLALYYAVLYCFRNRIEKDLIFKLRKIDTE